MKTFPEENQGVITTRVGCGAGKKQHLSLCLSLVLFSCVQGALKSSPKIVHIGALKLEVP